jgi:2-C-methyl-D-erythritol 4-phosphate cytidylyltransferase
MKLGVVIVAAGSSRRMGFDKLMAPLADRCVLAHSLTAFLQLEAVSQLVVVTDQDRFSRLPGHPSPKVSRCDGGTERHFSVFEGIQQLVNVDYIAVHDGARPLISSRQIEAVLDAAIIHKAASSAKRISDTVKRSDTSDFATESVSRKNLWAMETPQIFAADLLLRSYQKVIQESLLVTDEVSAVEYLGVKTKLVSNPTPNLKITFPEDIAFAEHLLAIPYEKNNLG